MRPTMPLPQAKTPVPPNPMSPHSASRLSLTKGTAAMPPARSTLKLTGIRRLSEVLARAKDTAPTPCHREL